ncbi:hypothetical protein GWI33_018456 [Rhynchophorus ferrugineus]|uniref:Uncharacterized protein n=1 Tax=Rhynchophorus ferrugineus TaxID=354439 RepID=A0A834HXT5_RHYFE|nr:hypothetical protein GWI33_018456 [Rhynchophorus ferrugineus]
MVSETDLKVVRSFPGSPSRYRGRQIGPKVGTEQEKLNLVPILLSAIAAPPPVLIDNKWLLDYCDDFINSDFLAGGEIKKMRIEAEDREDKQEHIEDKKEDPKDD